MTHPHVIRRLRTRVQALTDALYDGCADAVACLPKPNHTLEERLDLTQRLSVELKNLRCRFEIAVDEIERDLAELGTMQRPAAEAEATKRAEERDRVAELKRRGIQA